MVARFYFFDGKKSVGDGLEEWSTFAGVTGLDTLHFEFHIITSKFISVLSRSLGARQFLGNINLQLRIMWAIALWLPSLWQKRRAIQKRRVVPFEVVEAWLVK